VGRPRGEVPIDRFNVRLPEPDAEWVKRRAEEEERSAPSVIAEAVHLTKLRAAGADLEAEEARIKATRPYRALAEGGYYRGALYDGSIILELNATATRMKGRWLGFGRDPGEINDGPWQFTLVESDIGPAARAKWDVPPTEDSGGDDSAAPQG